MRRPRHTLIPIAAGALALMTAVAGCSGIQSNSAPAGAPGGAPAPSPAGQPGANPRGGDRDGFNPEISTDEEPTSSFAIDVDTASYAYTRRQILDGRRPDRSAVRPEEFINYFRQDYRQPGGEGFTVTMDGAALPPRHEIAEADRYRLLRVGLQTRADTSVRSDVALTFVVDVSGSMGEAGRLDLVRDALHYLIDQLRSSDHVAIVAYDDEARVLREMTELSNRRALHGAVDDLEPGGSTNLEDGLVRGYQVARDGFVRGASNRVILLSDGLANVGNTDADPILEQIREEADKEIALLGVGVGSQYGDALMERLADNGDGFVTYVSELEQAKRLFVERLPMALIVRALDAKVQVSFVPSTVATYRLIGYDNRVIANEDFRDDRVDGGEVGPGHSVTALYLIRLRDGVNGDVATATVRWLHPQTREASEVTDRLNVGDLDRSLASASVRLRVDYAAAYFAEVLRGSQYGDEVTLAMLAELAEGAARETDDGDVADLAALIRRAGD